MAADQTLFTHSYPVRTIYPRSLLQKAPATQIAFFDIETTGLSHTENQVTVGGLAYLAGGQIKVEQYFVPAPEAEGRVLRQFLDRLGDFTCLCHYNGATFDVPFLRARARHWRVAHPFDEVISIDWLPRARQVKGDLGFPNCQLMTVQEHLGLERQDFTDGGEVARMYKRWLRSGDICLRDQILLHNADDIVLLIQAVVEMERRVAGA